ncbi:Golgi apparatus membrane protein TVP23-like protein [Aduncisulcus paluster]|uniref:Golgi apparatus membrane protein TVP23 homolog n=1 Tax=Aduncisulcus paluster TaxID=2918883 RepID=A0ABQ5JTV0_9EUKA|nr:Golgi apparatus membrane protein TVP23-like protein [Aduncisulcus paluster]
MSSEPKKPDTPTKEEEEVEKWKPPKTTHPVAIVFMCIFKICGIVFYWTKNWLGLIGFILVILCDAFDFWTVKNICGRYLVGLRYWNIPMSNNTTKWLFESRSAGAEIGKFDSSWFWIWLWVWPILWLLFGIVNFFGFKLDNLLLNILGIGFGMVNAIGFMKCQGDYKKQIKALGKKAALKGLAKTMETE